MADQWSCIPYRVRDLYIKYAGEVAQLMQDFPDNPDAWILDTPEVGIVKAAETPIEPEVTPSGTGNPLRALWQTVNKPMSGPNPLSGPTRASGALQSLLGGPNPLTSALLYGTLGAGLGWGSGKLLSMLFPKRVKRDAGWRLGLPLGALIGGGGALALHGYPNVRQHGLAGLLRPSGIQKQSAEMPEGMEITEVYDAPTTLADVVDRATCALNTVVAKDNGFQKAAQIGRMFVPDIDVKYWLDTVRDDPYMSPATKAVVGSLPYAAGTARGSRIVSPMDVGRVALNAGLGAAIGNAIGMVAGPVLRLTPKARNDIQNAGILAGIFKTMGVA